MIVSEVTTYVWITTGIYAGVAAKALHDIFVVHPEEEDEDCCCVVAGMAATCGGDDDNNVVDKDEYDNNAHHHHHNDEEEASHSADTTLLIQNVSELTGPKELEQSTTRTSEQASRTGSSLDFLVSRQDLAKYQQELMVIAGSRRGLDASSFRCVGSDDDGSASGTKSVCERQSQHNLYEYASFNKNLQSAYPFKKQMSS